MPYIERRSDVDLCLLDMPHEIQLLFTITIIRVAVTVLQFSEIDTLMYASYFGPNAEHLEE